jgi:hypothetical protein
MTCEFLGCETKYPSFNFLGEKKGRFCSNHKVTGMVNVKKKR